MICGKHYIAPKLFIYTKKMFQCFFGHVRKGRPVLQSLMFFSLPNKFEVSIDELAKHSLALLVQLILKVRNLHQLP